MEKTKNPRVKICCIKSVEEAWTAIRYGASALGFVSAMPSGPGIISEESIARIVACVPPPIATFLLTSAQNSEEIIQQLQRCRTNTVQICDSLKAGSYENIRKAIPGIAIVQVIHITDDVSMQQAIDIAPQVDAILLDSGNQSLQIKELGGTGRVHDWNLSNRIREKVSIPIFLAGGLNPGNINFAVEQVAPFGVDVCTGVRSYGNLDDMKLKNFFENVKFRKQT